MTFNIGDNVIDSRDIIERIDVLKRDALDVEGKAELAALLAFQEEVEPCCPDWRYGVSLIHERYFVAYCREQLEDCGYLPRDLPWWIEIDWEKTADNMKQDYTNADLGSHTYWFQ